MARCKPEGGYENPAIGLWAIGCAMQLVSALILVMLASSLQSIKDVVDEDGSPEIKNVRTSVFVGLAIAQFVTSVLLMIVVIAGYFISRWFLVFSLFAGFLAEAASVASSILCGMILTGIADKNTYALEYVRSGSSQHLLPILDYSAEFGMHYHGMIVAFGVLSLASLVPFSRAQSMPPNARAMEAMVFISGAAIASVTAGVFLLQSKGLSSDITIGILWIASTALALVFVSLQKVCLPRLMSIVLAIIFVLLSIFAIVSTIVCANEFVKQKRLFASSLSIPQSQIVPWIQGLPEEDYKILKRANESADGLYFLVTAALSSSAFIFFVFSAMASFRSVFGPSRAEKLMSRDSAEEAIEAREEREENP
ncbi:hypothetical protein BESB_081440 [Besnoitia besnoiti]|uniref:Transmembrane protein n=1 Tax=Besnoitia besnoiti TaxID=94643 RepID=A0A2A9M4Q1_BESBE|nr:hypothetical protein BESB_081440 [Besnoitia besnoiti]PFH32945.1 hypothetical protein BESB_081440 [Besnoitia besnoiti]